MEVDSCKVSILIGNQQFQIMVAFCCYKDAFCIEVRMMLVAEQIDCLEWGTCWEIKIIFVKKFLQLYKGNLDNADLSASYFIGEVNDKKTMVHFC